MTDSTHTWAVVLAAGEGSRLRSLTTAPCGMAVPKQFCSLRGGRSLLDETLQRAHGVTRPERTCVIVAEQHTRWWSPLLHAVPQKNVIVQPANRGTGNGILLSLLHILERDPRATVVFLPSDHHVDDEAILRRSLREAVRQLQHHSRNIVLLGLQPDEIDPELGYIVPGTAGESLHKVSRFVEKPSSELAAKLAASGALWNAFIFATRARELVEIFDALFPQVAADMQAAVTHDAHCPMDPIATRHVYQHLEDIDFSKDVLQVVPQRLRVLTVPACGWSDLGTPARIGRTLNRALPPLSLDDTESGAELAPILVLAHQFMRQRQAELL